MNEAEHLNFANQDLRNRCFRGAYLRHADFSGSDIRGCDFTNATPIAANFERVKAGYSYKQIITLILFVAVFAGASLDSLAFAWTGKYATAVAIALALSVIAGLHSRSVVGLLASILTGLAVSVSGQQDFVLAVAIAFSFSIVSLMSMEVLRIFATAIAFSLIVACVVGFAGNFTMALRTPLVIPVAINFAGILTFLLAESEAISLTNHIPSQFANAMAIAQNFAIIALLTAKPLTYAIEQSKWLQGMIYGGITVICAIAAIFCMSIALKQVKLVCGTSFQNADLTDANFSYAALPNTDFRGAKLIGVKWNRTRFGSFFYKH